MPVIRFSEFGNRWKKTLLGDIAIFSKGKGISKSDVVDCGKTPCIRYGELYTIYGEVINEPVSRTNVPIQELKLSAKNDVIIPSSGETQIDIATASCVLPDGVAIGGDLNIIKTNNDGTFLSYYLNSKKKLDIARLSQGISVVHLYNKQLSKLSLLLPILPEQQKIAAFLSAVDKKIQLLQKKKELLEQYKKGVMQKIFSREIRFKDENGQDYPEWEEVVLSELLDYLQPTKYLVNTTDYSDKNDIPVLTAGKTFILGFTNEKTGVFKDDLPVIIFDDFTTSFKFVDFPFKAKSSAMKILKAKNENCNIHFIYESMKGIKFPLGEHKRYWISEYQYMKILYPCYDEQKVISNFLNSLDLKIEIFTNQISKVQQFKKGLLQQMFV